MPRTIPEFNINLARLLLLCSLCLCSAASIAQSGPAPVLEPAPANVPGGVYVLDHQNAKVTFQGREALYVADKAFVAIPMDTKAGNYEISLAHPEGHSTTHAMTVVGKQFTEQHITIENQAMVDPPAETLARIREEGARQRKLYRDYSNQQDLSAGFALPLTGITTSLYGHRRFFYGKPRSPHSGLDIAAAQGSPIQTAGRGTVTLADDLYFNGNTVFVDHGQGLVTMYCHMSEITVAVGDVVEPGDVIGLVGATGRATGPHLHWSVSLAGYRIDPELFLTELNAVVEPQP